MAIGDNVCLRREKAICLLSRERSHINRYQRWHTLDIHSLFQYLALVLRFSMLRLSHFALQVVPFNKWPWLLRCLLIFTTLYASIKLKILQKSLRISILLSKRNTAQKQIFVCFTLTISLWKSAHKMCTANSKLWVLLSSYQSIRLILIITYKCRFYRNCSVCVADALLRKLSYTIAGVKFDFPIF